MAYYSYTTMDRIFSFVRRNITDQFSEEDVIEWTGFALSQIGVRRMYEESVAFLEVKNYQTQYPNGLHGIIQIARDREWNAHSKECLPKTVEKELSKEKLKVKRVDPDCVNCSDQDNIDYVLLDCNGLPINNYEVAYYRPFFDLVGEHTGWFNSEFYKRRFTPVVPTNNSFASGIFLCDIEDEIYRHSVDEVQIIKSTKTLRFSFKEGRVALAYLKQLTDRETGYPMIPDDPSYIEAVLAYIKKCILERQCLNGRDAACKKAEKADMDWHWYCRQSSNKELMPHGEMENEDLYGKNYRLPKENTYEDFFGSQTYRKKLINGRR